MSAHETLPNVKQWVLFLVCKAHNPVLCDARLQIRDVIMTDSIIILSDDGAGAKINDKIWT
jgi:hypothetical protein